MCFADYPHAIYKCDDVEMYFILEIFTHDRETYGVPIIFMTTV